MKVSQNPYQQYKSNQVNTADPKTLIIMLYDGAIRFLSEAKDALNSYKTYDVANEKILRAQDIITELMLSLDMDKGGEIADNLMNLYSYMKKNLLEANMNKKEKPIIDTLKILSELKEAWEKMDEVKSGGEAPEKNSSGKGFAAQG